MAKYREEGVEALLRQQRGRRRGSGRQLSPDEEADLQALLRQHTPEQLDMPYALWSREALQALIRQETELQMPMRSVDEYLKRWGFTVQTPNKQAYEQRPAEVQRWLVVDYPPTTAAFILPPAPAGLMRFTRPITGARPSGQPKADEGGVHFTYKDYRTEQRKVMALSGEEFGVRVSLSPMPERSLACHCQNIASCPMSHAQGATMLSD